MYTEGNCAEPPSLMAQRDSICYYWDWKLLGWPFTRAQKLKLLLLKDCIIIELTSEIKKSHIQIK